MNNLMLEDKRFKKILYDEEISRELLLKVVDVIEREEGRQIVDLEVKTSNCTSFVFIMSDTDKVYQYFCSGMTFSRIADTICNINRFYIEYVDYIYNLGDFIVNIKGLIKEERIIKWNKIVTLNSFPRDKLVELIDKNLIKLLWDISKALYGLHANEIVHRDTRIDNIGIHNGNFILFDFDGSINSSTASIMKKDQFDLFQSIQFYIGDKMVIHNNKYYELLLVVIHWYKQRYAFDDDKKAISALDSLKIIYE